MYQYGCLFVVRASPKIWGLVNVWGPMPVGALSPRESVPLGAPSQASTQNRPSFNVLHILFSYSFDGHATLYGCKCPYVAWSSLVGWSVIRLKRCQKVELTEMPLGLGIGPWPGWLTIVVLQNYDTVSWLGHLTCKIVPEMTYNVSHGTLNPTTPYYTIPWRWDNLSHGCIEF